jgi:hypothetical protein
MSTNPKRLNVNPFLTNYSLAYAQDPARFQAGQIFTPIATESQYGKFAKFPKNYFLKNSIGPRAMGQPFDETSLDMEFALYSCDETGEQVAIDRRVMAQGQTSDQTLMAMTRMLTQHGLIYLENLWASQYFKTSVWATDYTGVSSGPSSSQFVQFDQASSTPIKTIRDLALYMEQTTGFRPNTLVAGAKVYEAWVNHADLTNLFKYTQSGLVKQENLREVFEIERIFVPKGIQATGNYNGTISTDFIVNPKAFWLGYVDPNPAPMVPTAGARFDWTGLLGGAANAQGGVIEEWDNPDRKSHMMSITQACGYLQIANDLGIFAASAVG